MKQNIIDTIYKENLELLNFLEERNEPSFNTQFNAIFTKTLLLSIASYFEHEICKMVQVFIEHKAQRDECIIAIVKQKAINRQYHTYFDWEGKNANKFFSLFGSNFKEERSREINNNPILKSAIISFLELGNERNKLVHQNFASYNIEKTAEEVYLLYEKAMPFMEFLICHFSNPLPDSNQYSYDEE
jgi:hypothetical protein